jgi:endo-alpha-N-acetylgalactosaminidase
MKRFTAFVGIDDEKGFSRYASVVARVEGDGRELYRSPVLSTAMPEILIDLDISGVSELVLISDDAAQGLGTNTNCDDHVSWADPIIE